MYFHYTEIIFNIKEKPIKFKKVSEDGSIHFTLEMPAAEQVYPHCGTSIRKSKGKRPRDTKFGATQHQIVTATYLQRGYKYLECNHTFIEKNPFVYRYKQDTRASNGFTEGCNNSIKVLKRISYGLRNFDRFRGRILLLSKKDKKE